MKGSKRHASSLKHNAGAKPKKVCSAAVPDVPMSAAACNESAAKSSKQPELPANISAFSDSLEKGIVAVKLIQRCWRMRFQYYTTKRIVNEYRSMCPTVDKVKVMSFESLVVYLREKPVIAFARSCLQRIHLLTTFRHGSPSKALSPENVNVRVVLAGFMIAYRPTHVFESMGALEQALFEAATRLLPTFEKICNCIIASGSFKCVPHELTKDFPTMLFEYLKSFKAWKIPDEAKLTCRIKHALIALYQAEEHLPPDEPEDSKLRMEFKTQVERLRTKLLQIAGENAVKQFDEQRLAGQVPGGSGGGSGGKGTGGGIYATLPGRMTNEQLAHELLLDPTFQLDDSGGCHVENPVFHRIRESFHQAFWESLVDDLRLPTPCYVRVLRVLAEIRDGIVDLAGERERGNIKEAVDLDFIKQQAESGLYTWNNCCKLVLSIVEVVQRVQAPKRDDDTNSKWQVLRAEMADAGAEEQPRAFCKALEFLLDRVNIMRIDAANARLRLIAPVIKDHGIDYERGKFEDKLKDGSLTLERTTAWIAKSIRHELGRKNVTLDSLLSGSASAYVHVHSAAMLSLVSRDFGTIKSDTVPETLLFDVYRLNVLSAEFRFLAANVTLFTTLLHSYSAIPATPITPGPLTEFNNALEKAAALTTFDMDPALRIAVDTVEQTTFLSRNSKDVLIRALRQCIEPTDAVCQLITDRVATVVSRTMKEGRVNAELFKKLPVLAAFKDRLDKTAAKLMSLCNLNRTVYLPTYNKLIVEATLEINRELAAVFKTE